MRDVKNPFFSVNTNDLDSFKLLMTVTKQNKAVDLTGMSANIAILKPDKKTVFQECEITDAENGKVEVILTSQAYIVPGTHYAELMIYGEDDLVAVTCRFAYNSVQGLMDDDTVESSDEWQAIHKKVDEAQAILDDLRENGTGIDAQARTQLQVLNEKVDENHQQLSAQLAQIEQQINGLEISKMSKVEGVTKQELQQTDDNIRDYLFTQLSQIGTMSPKGAYPTLQDLENAYPSGTDGIYIVQADGHWYYWSGSNWADGGLYQALPWDEFMTEQDEEWVI